MDRCGWAGELFCVKLFSHGYVFVAKGTVARLEPVLVQEAAVYRALERLQGETIPVLLGSMRLARPLQLTVKAAIVRLLLLSWAGEEAWRADVDQALVRAQAAYAQRQVQRAGVRQLDRENERNVLWNAQLQRVFLIDFEYTELLQPPPAASASTDNRPSRRQPGCRSQRPYQPSMRRCQDISAEPATPSDADGTKFQKQQVCHSNHELRQTGYVAVSSMGRSGGCGGRYYYR
jgi:hypothetical protein